MQPLFHTGTHHKTKRSSMDASQFAEFEEEVHKHWVSSRVLPKDIATVSPFEKSEQQVRTNPIIATEKRRAEFRTYLEPKIAALLGETVAKSVANQLKTNHSISTAEHYIPLSPNALNATLFNSLAYFNRDGKDRENIIVFGCSGVSISNPWYARGHLFHSLIDGEFVENQLNFFGRAQDSIPVIAAKAYTREAKKLMLSSLSRYRSEKQIKKREFNMLRELVEHILFSKEVLQQDKYIDQITLTNFALWKKIFSSHQEHVPNLVFLSQEQIARELILKYHLTKGSPIHELIFNKEWHTLIYKLFEGIPCCFSTAKNSGTFLFWATPPGKGRMQLFMKDGVLSSHDGSYTRIVTPENIEKALEQQEILPSVMLTFILLSFYYGFYLAGGLMQPSYLSQIKDAYVSLLRTMGEDKEASFVEPVAPNGITMPRPALAFLDGPDGARVPASGLDLYLYGNSGSWPKIMDAMKKITLGELYYRVYPDIYKNINKNPDKREDLLTITAQDIEEYAHLKQKIPAWATLTH